MFAWQQRVYIEDTDMGGIVYYANYLKFMERARTEWLRQLGFSQQALSEQDCLFVVQSLQLDYQRSARLDDELRITVQVQKLGRASMTIEQQVFNGEQLLCQGTVRVACIQTNGKPRSMPSDIQQALQAECSADSTSKETL